MPDTEPEDAAYRTRRHRAEVARREAQVLRAGVSSPFWQVLRTELEKEQAGLVESYDRGLGSEEYWKTVGKREAYKDLLNIGRMINTRDNTTEDFDAEERHKAESKPLPPITGGL